MSGYLLYNIAILIQGGLKNGTDRQAVQWLSESHYPGFEGFYR